MLLSSPDPFDLAGVGRVFLFCINSANLNRHTFTRQILHLTDRYIFVYITLSNDNTLVFLNEIL